LQPRTNIRLEVELVDPKSGEQLWVDQYDRDFSELFLVQDDVVQDVARQLRFKVPGENDRLSKRYTENAEAYQCYLRGRHWFESRSAEGFRKSVENFRNAIRADSRYALARAELAAVLYLPCVGWFADNQPR
jgi:adenylate cyclase